MLQRLYLIALLLVSINLAVAEDAATPGKRLPPGPMQAKVKAACTQCHNATRITEQHMSRQQWSDQLDKMESLGANIPAEDREGFLKYLTKNFGPTKGPAKHLSKKPAAAAN